MFALWDDHAAMTALAVNILVREWYSALHQALSSWTKELFAELHNHQYHIQVLREHSKYFNWKEGGWLRNSRYVNPNEATNTTELIQKLWIL